MWAITRLHYTFDDAVHSDERIRPRLATAWTVFVMPSTGPGWGCGPRPPLTAVRAAAVPSTSPGWGSGP